MRRHLLIIDAQNDFCDLPPEWCPPNSPYPALNWPPKRPAPALPVPGAHADMLRLSQWLSQHGAHIQALTLTFDTHQRLDIAHPDFWLDLVRRTHPLPFTTIAAADVRAGRFAPAREENFARALSYLDALESCGLYRLTVWPVHCEVGSWGHGLHPAVLSAVGQWQSHSQRFVRSVLKGLNPWTEHYSALRAEVPDPNDPTTALDHSLLAQLAECDQLIIAGEASSHCVRATVQDLITFGGADLAARTVLLRDCMSPVSGFIHEQERFFHTAQAAGVQLSSTEELVF